jgi:DNA-binding SARP family transcriptional activator
VTACGDDPAQWRAAWEDARQYTGGGAASHAMAGDDNSPTRAALQFRVLGSIAVSRAGVELDGLGQRGRALLAVFLLNANRLVSAERLERALWQDDPPAGSRALSAHVSRLRKVLIRGTPAGGPDLLSTAAGGYRLDLDESQLDLTRFERLLAAARRARDAGLLDEAVRLYRQALDEWSGEPLVNIDSSILVGERRALTERHRAAVVESLEARMDHGQYRDVAADCQQLLGEDLLDQHVVALLMRALYITGRSAEALAVYRDARLRLRNELGLDPQPHLQRVHNAVLTNEFDRLASPETTTKA